MARRTRKASLSCTGLQKKLRCVCDGRCEAVHDSGARKSILKLVPRLGGVRPDVVKDDADELRGVCAKPSEARAEGCLAVRGEGGKACRECAAKLDVDSRDVWMRVTRRV